MGRRGPYGIPAPARAEYNRRQAAAAEWESAIGQAEEKWENADSDERGEMIEKARPFAPDDGDFADRMIEGYAEYLLENQGDRYEPDPRERGR